MKKIISLVLALTMLMGMLPTTALAAENASAAQSTEGSDASSGYKRLQALTERGSVGTTYDLGYTSSHYKNYVRSAFDIKTGGAARLSIEQLSIAHGEIYVQFFASDYTKISSTKYTPPAVVSIPAGCDFIRVEIQTTAELDEIAIRFYDGTDEPREAKRSGINEVSEKLTYKVSDDVHTTSRLMLPPNYSIDGEKVPLILWLEGSGSGLSTWGGDFNSNKLPYLQYLRDEGFAVFSVYAWGSEYAAKYPKCGNSFPYPIPTNLACIREGIEYICDRYNIDADNIHIMSKSQGGQCALYYASCNELNVKSIGMFAPVLDYLSMPGEAMYKDTRAAIADDLDFTGDVEYFASDRFLSYSDEGRAFLRQNLDKLLTMNEAWTNLSGATAEELFEASMDDCETFWTEGIWKTDRNDIYTHTEYAKTANVPVKIWGARDDAATPYLKMVEVVEQLKNGGSVAEMVTLPNGTGGHGCADVGSVRVDVTTALGIEHKNVPIGWVENVEWIRTYSAHTHDYVSTVTPPTCTEQGYTTYTCECGDTYRTEWLDEAAYNGKTIACIGDSITYAYGVTQGKTDYVTLLAKQLGMNYIRLGDSGTTLCTDGSRTCNIGRLTEDQIQGADIVTIAMGINDFCAAGAGYYELGDISSTDTSTIYGAARMWCERIEALRKTDSLSHTQFYFMTPVITSWNNSVTSGRNWDQSKTNIHGYTLRDLCNAIMEVAALYDVAVIDMNLLSGMYYVDALDNNVAVFGGDGVHPGEKGHEMMAAAMANALLQNDLRDDHAHTFGSWITTTWPSCTGGEQQRVCTVCSAAESRTLASNGNHRYCAVITPPTYTQQGYTTYTCSSCGDSYISDYTAATQPHSYRWEMQNNTLVSVSENGNTANALTLTSGSIADGTLKAVRGNLQNKVRLNHDLPWIIEWRSAGNWDGMLLASADQSSSGGLTYLFRFAGMNLLALGEHAGTWNNYGLIHHIDMTEAHVFRLENRIAADGTNAVYLLVDGQEIGTMDNHYVGGTNKNQTVNWANGKDLVFGNIGTSSHPMKDMKLDYLQIWEQGHVHNYESTVTPPTCTKQGCTTYTCACGDSYVDDYVNANGHSYGTGVCSACGDTLAGKKVSILGDSISTYTDVSNNTSYNSTIGNNKVYYSAGTLGVDREDTWWQQTLDVLDMELCVNNSWSGSAIFGTRSGTVGAYVDRCVQLHNTNTGEEPDIILVFLGTNDFSYTYDGGELGNYDLGLDDEIDFATLIQENQDGTFTYEAPDTSAEAYAIMLHKMQQRYPEAEIYCMSLMTRRSPVYSKEDVGQPTEFNAKLREVIDMMGAHYIELEGLFTPDPADFDLYMGDKRVHPNKAGMDLMTEAVASALMGRQAELCTISYSLNGIESSNATAHTLIGGEYHAVLSAADGRSDISVSVTMDGEDVTASCYQNGEITIANVSGDIVITASVIKEPANYRWELIDGALVSNGENENTLTLLAGSVSNGVQNSTQYALAENVVLMHDQPWVVEWKSSGDWSGMLLTSTTQSATSGMEFIFRTFNTTGLLALGYYTGSQYNNYGIPLAELKMDMNKNHTYRMENRISEDNSNMVYLLIDGVEIGALNHYYIGGTKDQNATVDWVNGQDFTFGYIGSTSHPLKNMELQYLQVWESGIPQSVPDFGAAVKSADGSIREFNTVDEAIQAAAPGDTVMLLKDAEIYCLLVPVDVDFDLNGHVLTADYVASFGNIVDSSQDNTGLLKVSEKKILLQKNNLQLPVGDPEGYRFVEVLKFNRKLYAENYKLVFQPLFEEAAHPYILQGKELTGLTVGVKISWQEAQGARSQLFTYNDTQITQFIQSYKGPGTNSYNSMFSLTLTGAQHLENLQFQIVVKSETGVEILSDPVLYPST